MIKFEGCYHGHADSFLVAAGSGVITLGLPDSPGARRRRPRAPPAPHPMPGRTALTTRALLTRRTPPQPRALPTRALLTRALLTRPLPTRHQA